MKKFFCLIFAVIFFSASSAFAEIKNFTGEGFSALESETLDYAKNKAKADAARNIAEQIFVEVQSQTEVKNSELTHDEIILKTEGLMKILDVKYRFESAENNTFVVCAVVTAEVDTDEVEKILKMRAEEK